MMLEAAHAPAAVLFKFQNPSHRWFDDSKRAIKIPPLAPLPCVNPAALKSKTRDQAFLVLDALPIFAVKEAVKPAQSPVGIAFAIVADAPAF